MKVTILILLVTFTDRVISNTPYCEFSYSVTNYISKTKYLYTCKVTIDGEMSNSNEIWATHDQNPGMRHADVFVLAVAEKSRSFFNSFSSIYCRTFRNLKIIDMSSAEIEAVDSVALKGCKSLTYLIFYQNKIREIHENLLVNNPELQEVHLSFNELPTLPENLFIKQKKLKVLELSFNAINFLPNKIFQSLNNLEKLKLDGNKLESLSPNLFKNLQKLTELDLSQNQVGELPENLFNPLKSLKILKLHSNKISIIRAASFGVHPSLNFVTLSKNELFGIDENFIKNIPIRSLSMRGNTCSNETPIKRKDMDKKLQNCYDNFGYSNFDLELPTSTVRTTKPRRPTTLATSPTITSTTTQRTTASTTKIPKTTSAKATRRYRPVGTTTTKKPARVYNHECGTRPSGTPLIINGEDFIAGTYPWMAVLVTNENRVHCGGVLISSRKVLTAGHCIYTKSNKIYNEKHLRVVLGSHDLDSDIEVSRIVVEIQRIYTHKHWNPLRRKFDSDIAVVVLNDEVQFNDRIQPICLPYKNKIVESMTMGVVVGYGKTENRDKEYSKIPKQAQAPIHDLNVCVTKYPQLQSIASRTTFCGGHGNGTGVCTGDSGSGLFVHVNNVFYLRGLVSSSLIDNEIGCDVNKYSVYTNVTRFINWINGIQVRKLSSRMGEEDDEEEGGNKLWDISSTLSPPSGNDTDVDYSDQNQLEVKESSESDSDYDVTTYETGLVWSS